MLDIPEPSPLPYFTDRVISIQGIYYNLMAGYRGDEFHVLYIPVQGKNCIEATQALRGSKNDLGTTPIFICYDLYTLPLLDRICDEAKALGYGKRRMRLRMRYTLHNVEQVGLVGDHEFFPAAKRRQHFREAFDSFAQQMPKSDL